MMRAAILTILCIMPLAFGAMPVAAGSVTIETASGRGVTDSFKHGDLLIVRGIVDPVVKGQDVIIQVFSPDGSLWSSKEHTPTSQGRYPRSLGTFDARPNFGNDTPGTYPVIVRYAGIEGMKNIQFFDPEYHTQPIRISVSETIHLSNNAEHNTIRAGTPSLSSIKQEVIGVQEKVETFLIRDSRAFPLTVNGLKVAGEVRSSSKIESIDVNQVDTEEDQGIEIRLKVSGEDGSRGKTAIKVPADLPYIGETEVNVNGKTAPFTEEPAGGFISITVSYTHSLVDIQVIIGSTSTRTASTTADYMPIIIGVIIGVIALVVVATVAVGFRRRKRS